VNNPKIILCDEPTGNLDSKTGALVMLMLKKLNEKGKTLIIVTHDPSIAEQADRIITIRDGQVVAS
jgi:putative ABC transport system ATP-binding protein